MIPLGGISTFGQRMSRFRDSIGCEPWIERSKAVSKRRKLAKMDIQNDKNTGKDEPRRSPRRLAPINTSAATWNPVNRKPLQQTLNPYGPPTHNPSSAPHPNQKSHLPMNPLLSMPPPPEVSNIPWQNSSRPPPSIGIDFRLIAPQNEADETQIRNALRLTRADFTAYHGMEAPTLPNGNCYNAHYEFLQNAHTSMWACPGLSAPLLLGLQSWSDSFTNWLPPVLTQEQLKCLLSAPALGYL